MISKSIKLIQKFSQQRNNSTNSQKKVAIVLSGSGVYDGTEVTEAVSLFIALNKYGVDFQCYAPNKPQMHVVNHLNGTEIDQTRNVMIESARIARGQVSDLQNLNSQEYDAIFIPGGFGAAKNLSDFAVKGGDLQLDSQFSKILQDFRNNDKVIAACCISPVLLAKQFGNEQVSLTLGCTGDKWPYAGSIEAAKSLGAKTEEAEVNQVVVDEKLKIVTSPAFMYEGNFYEISQGVEQMVKKAIELI